MPSDGVTHFLRKNSQEEDIRRYNKDIRQSERTLKGLMVMLTLSASFYFFSMSRVRFRCFFPSRPHFSTFFLCHVPTYSYFCLVLSPK